MAKLDLRVIKTLDSIETALITLLKTRPIDRITVTELAHTARINKGTFYLHYTDIYDLYDQTLRKYLKKPIEESDFFSDFFDDPELFLNELSGALDAGFPVIDRITRNGERSIDYKFVIATLREKTFETGRIHRDLTNEMKLTMIFGSFAVLHSDYPTENAEQVKKLTADMIRSLFLNAETA
ncbi:MAG: TetR/AcrR family transcriptional regulator [Eubacterium sp.]|nr:TetR/AcrR family transcriptional regulator [Eubacterium sp.]